MRAPPAPVHTPAHRSLYAALDRFPSPKGAGTHIGRMAEALFQHQGGGLLYVLGDGDLPAWQLEGDVEIVRHPGQEDNYLLRALGFRRRLARLLEIHGAGLRLSHFRDPFAGVPILRRPGRRDRTVYEVNGLPSIELPQRFPDLPEETLRKLRAEEELCLREADLLITPSHVMRENLLRLGAPAEKLEVVENGADLLDEAPPRPADAPGAYLLYFGALQGWQGVEVLLAALSRLRERADLHLVICSASHERQARPLLRQAARLGLTERVHLRYRLSQAELRPWLAHAAVSVAPLTECERNLTQGCCPLKILESMAAGVPVVASDLPAVRELISDGETGLLARPDRPAELARAIAQVLEDPAASRRRAAAARARIAAGLTWGHATAKLRALYDRLLAGPLRPSPPQGPGPLPHPRFDHGHDEPPPSGR